MSTLKMRLLFLSFFLIFTSTGAPGQIRIGSGSGQGNKKETHVEWSQKTVPEKAGKGDTVTLYLIAHIDEGWHIYSPDLETGQIGAGQPTDITFKEHASYDLVGSLNYPEPYTKKEKIGNNTVTLRLLEGKDVAFKQKAVIRSAKPDIRAEAGYMACTENTCTPPLTEPFSFAFDKESSQKQAVSRQNDKEDKSASGQKPEQDTAESAKNKIKKDSSVKANKTASKEPADTSGDHTDAVTTSGQDQDKGGRDKKGYYGNNGSYTPDNSQSLWGFILFAFTSGLVAWFTPCVFPMIPMTVTFFTKQSETSSKTIRNAFVFGGTIILIFTLIGTLVARLNGPGFANWFSTHWGPNVVFFAIFVLFALSMLGMFEITLPNSFINKIDAKSEKRGIAGIFFMALTLVVVSFSCTVPLVGWVLIESFGGQMIKPIAGMLSFSFAFAIPFTFFALFPSLMKSLPKSGGWLNSVKVVLGFLELAFAFKFLSVADQTYHWDILNRNIYITIHIAIFALMSVYLLGKFKLPGDSDISYISVPRLLLAIVSFAVVIYLTPGLFGAPLKALSGYLPPQTSQDFNLTRMMSNNSQESSGSSTTVCSIPQYAKKFELPHNLRGYFSYEEGLACAKKLNKPVLVDFTGHGCVNCRKMEANVWSAPRVLRRLREDYVLISLYVDDKTTLPKEEWYISPYDNELKQTIGEQNFDLQLRKFNSNAQPFYALLDPNGNLLTNPMSYNTNIQDFVDFLEKGQKAFQQKQLSRSK